MRMQIEPTFIGRLRLPTVMPSGKRIFAKRSLSVGAARPLPVGITRTAAVPGNRNDSLIGLVEVQKKAPHLRGFSFRSRRLFEFFGCVDQNLKRRSCCFNFSNMAGLFRPAHPYAYRSYPWSPLAVPSPLLLRVVGATGASHSHPHVVWF